MDIDKLRLWARKMGYQGRMDDFGLILNASTDHIWKQVIDRVRPWQEIEEIRINIIIQRMHHECNGAMIPPVVLACPSTQVEIWQANKELQQSNKRLKLQLDEGKKELRQLEFSQNMLKTQIEHTEIKLKEEKAKEYLYRMKNKQLLEQFTKKQGQLSEIETMFRSTSSQDNISHELLEQELQQTDEVYKKHSAPTLSIYLCSQERKYLEQIRKEIEKEFSSTLDYEDQCKSLHEDNLMAMQMIQIENELEARELRRKYLTLEKECNEQENAIIQKYENNIPSQVQDIQNFLIDKAAYIERNLCVKLYSQEIESFISEDTPTGYELKQTLLDIEQAQKQLASKNKDIKEKHMAIKNFEAELNEERTKSTNLLENLRKFAGRSSRTLDALKSQKYSKEIDLWQGYRVTNKESPSTFPYTSTPNIKETLCHVVSAIEFPITDVNTLLEFFRQKYARFVSLTQLRTFSKDFKFAKCHSSALDGDPLANNCTLGELRELSSDMPCLRDHDKALEIWKQLPFADCISNEIVRDGHGYKHYEDAFMYYLNQLNSKA